MKRIEYNENYFRTIDSQDKAYFLGFIFADGCVQSKNRYQLTIKIHPKDIDILEKFKKSIKFEGDIYMDRKREICQISISGKEIVSDLISHGVIPNKTMISKYPEIPEKFEIDFIRGFFDGDGYIGIKTDKRTGHKNGNLVIVCGSMDFINKLNERMSSLFNIRLNKTYGPKYKKYKFISWTGLSDLEKIYEKFYNSGIFMNRKKKTFDEVYRLHKSKNKYRKDAL